MTVRSLDPARSATRWTIAAACTGQFLVVLDISIVNVALPSIRTSLGFDAIGLQWVVNAYTLLFAGFLLLGGRAADLLGRRRTFMLGLGLFGAASLAAGLATTPAVLVVARAAQGLGAAVLAPASLTLITTALPAGPDRLRALASWSAVGVAGGAVGSLLGGLLTEVVSWRLIFLVNLPVVAVVLVVTVVYLTESRTASARNLDLLGAVTVTAALSALVYGTIQIPESGWTSPVTMIALLGGVLGLGLFVLVEGRVAAAPLMPLRLWRLRSVSGANALVLLTGAAGFSMWYFLSLYMQNVLQYSAIRTGIGFLPHSLSLIASARLAPAVMRRIGTRPTVAAGGVIGAAGFAWQSQLAAGSSYLGGVFGPGVTMCIGLGLTITPLAAAATDGVRGTDAGLVSGMFNSARTVGGAIGLAALATLATGRTATVRSEGGQPVGEALTAGYSLAFAVSSVAFVACAVGALLLPRRPRRADRPNEADVTDDADPDGYEVRAATPG